MKNDFIHSVCFSGPRSSLSMEMHRLHQLYGQSILVKTRACSDKESCDRFVRARREKTVLIDLKLFKSYQVYQAAFQERVDLL